MKRRKYVSWFRMCKPEFDALVLRLGRDVFTIYDDPRIMDAWERVLKISNTTFTDKQPTVRQDYFNDDFKQNYITIVVELVK